MSESRLTQADAARLMYAQEHITACLREVNRARTEKATVAALEKLGQAKIDFDDLIAKLTDSEGL